jgi:hypothetical protein
LEHGVERAFEVTAPEDDLAGLERGGALAIRHHVPALAARLREDTQFTGCTGFNSHVAVGPTIASEVRTERPFQQ